MTNSAVTGPDHPADGDTPAGGGPTAGGAEWPPVGVDCPWFGSDLGGWLVGRRRVMDGSEAMWLAGLAAFDREGGWAADGQLSCVAWLMWRTRMGRATAFERLRVAHELDRRPVLAEALSAGRISYCAVRLMVRAEGASPGVDRAFVQVAEAGTLDDVERVVRSYRLHDEQDRPPADRPLHRGMRVRSLGNGMVRVEAILTDVEGAELEAALRSMLDRDSPTDPTPTEACGPPVDESARADYPAGAEPDLPAKPDLPAEPGDRADGPVDESARADCTEESSPEPVSWAERQADALMSTARAALASLPAPGADRYTVHVVVQHERGCLLGAGPLAEGEWQRVACDCGTVVHHRDPDGQPLALGRRQRSWSVAQRRAVTVRDGGRCRWPGCSHTHVDIHHLLPWSEGGRTDVTNAILLCPGHHTRIHQGFRAEGSTEGRLTFTRPDGTPIGSSTARPSVPHLPLAA